MVTLTYLELILLICRVGHIFDHERRIDLQLVVQLQLPADSASIHQQVVEQDEVELCEEVKNPKDREWTST